jgi:hypothetical protein
MNILLVLLLFACIAALIWYRYTKRVEEEESLHMTETKKDIFQESNVEKDVILQEEVRPLTTMDASMIKARIEKLEIVVHLEDNKKERLHRKVLDMCKKNVEGLWWEPLAWFSRNLRTKDDQTIVILNSKRVMLSTIANINDTLSIITRLGELQFLRIDPPGDDFEFDIDDLLVDGEYKMIYQRRDKGGSFPITIKDRKFDVLQWMREINNILRRLKIPFRFVVFAPNGDVWCIVYTPIVSAERAIKSNWGVV